MSLSLCCQSRGAAPLRLISPEEKLLDWENAWIEPESPIDPAFQTGAET